MCVQAILLLLLLLLIFIFYYYKSYLLPALLQAGTTRHYTANKKNKNKVNISKRLMFYTWDAVVSVNSNISMVR